MYKLTHILIALALPIVGMAQTQTCIDGPTAEFDFNDTINNFNNCSPTFMSNDLIACDLEQIKVTFSGVENPNMLVIDIRRPGASCPMRFASSELLSLENYNGLLSECLCPSSQIIPWDNSTLGGGFFILNVSGWSDYNLTGIWDVGLSFIGSSFTPNEISLDFVGSCLSCSGCMDSTATNYDPDATIDCVDCCSYSNCSGFGGTLTVGGGSWQSEVGWTLSLGDTVISTGGAPASLPLCLDAGCYTFNMTDSYGDGWNGNTYSFDGYDGVNFFTGDVNTADTGDIYSEGTDYLDLNGGACTSLGCVDPGACNYDPNATVDDGNCEYPNDNYDCFGNCALDEDCAGVCGGNAAFDECGVCGGSGITDDACDCEGNVLDQCGVCGGSGIADGACDCAGNVLDECGVCGGSGITDDACDCAGNVLDECGVCDGSGITDGACDCEGNVLDQCGVCGGNGYSCSGCTNTVACNYDPMWMIDNGSCEYESCADCCGEPWGDGSMCEGICGPCGDDDSCLDECGEPWGDGSMCAEGCTDPMACNWDPMWMIDNGSCDYSCVDCCGEPWGDGSICAGICGPCGDDDSCLDECGEPWGDGSMCAEGCTDPMACNWDPMWMIDNGSCDYSCVDCCGEPWGDGSICAGICGPCGDDDSCLDECGEPWGDGSMCAEGCTYSAACNYNEMATTDDGSCDFDSCDTVIEGCMYSDACNFNADATDDDGYCEYPDPGFDCQGNCINDADGDGICDFLDVATEMLEIENPFLELSYVQYASPFFSFYDGWFDADFVKIGICNPQINLESSFGNTSGFKISINFEDSDEFVPFPVEVSEFLQEWTLHFPANVLNTASHIVSIRLQDSNGNTIDNLYQDETPWPNVTLNGTNHAPGQHRIVRQPWVLQGKSEVNESEWLVCDENWDMPFYSSWNLESTTFVPMDPNSEGCLNDQDGDGICDQLEIPMYCQNVNATQFQSTL